VSIESEAERLLRGRGWEQDAGLDRKQAAEVNVPRFRLVPAAELEPRPMDWLVTDLFERDSLVTVYGPPGSAKSFAALDMACSIATGSEYHGRAVQTGPTVYVAGEGFNGIARRLQAWRIVHGVAREDLPLSVSNMPAALTDPENLTTVLEALRQIDEPPALVVVDTVARNFGPADENSTQDMTRFVNACDEIRLAHGCAVMLVHHVGHGDQTRARGSSVLNGAIDTALRITKDEAGTVIVECTKQKDAPEPKPFAFKFRTVELGFENDDGTQATSAILHPCDVPKREPKKPQGKLQQKAFAALVELYREQGQNLEQSDRDPEQARVLLTDWRDASTKAGVPRNRWYEAKDALTKKGAVQLEPPYCKPVSGA
jgi:hypothetical protein